MELENRELRVKHMERYEMDFKVDKCIQDLFTNLGVVINLEGNSVQLIRLVEELASEIEVLTNILKSQSIEKDALFFNLVNHKLPRAATLILLKELPLTGSFRSRFISAVNCFLKKLIAFCCVILGQQSLKVALLMLLILGGNLDVSLLLNEKELALTPHAELMEKLYKQNSHCGINTQLFYSRFGHPKVVEFAKGKVCIWPNQYDRFDENPNNIAGIYIQFHNEMDDQEYTGQLVAYDKPSKMHKFKPLSLSKEPFWIDLSATNYKRICLKSLYEDYGKVSIDRSVADIGLTIRIYLAKEDEWCQGRIVSWSEERGHGVVNSDGKIEYYHDLAQRDVEIVKCMNEDGSVDVVEEMQEMPLEIREEGLLCKAKILSTGEKQENEVFDGGKCVDCENLCTNGLERVEVIDPREHTRTISWYLLENIEHFASLGGCEILCENLQENSSDSPESMRLLLLVRLLIIESIMCYFNEEFRNELAHIAYSKAVVFLMEMKDAHALTCPLNEYVILADIISRINIFADMNYGELMSTDRMTVKSRERRNLVEKFLLNLSARYLSSEKLEKKLFGLETILQAIRIVSSIFISKQSKKCIELSALDDKDWVVKWLSDNEIVSKLYSKKTMHPEIARRGGSVVLFLADEKALKEENLTQLWQFSRNTNPQVESAVKVVLLAALSKLDPSARRSFFDENIVNFMLHENGMDIPDMKFIYKLTTHFMSADKSFYQKQGITRKKTSNESYDTSYAAVEQVQRSKSPISATEEGEYYGLYLFWDFIQDSNKNCQNLNAIHEAICLIVDLLEGPFCCAQKEKLISLCIQNIINKTSVPQSLELLSSLIGAFPQFRASWFSRDIKSQQNVILNLEKNYKLLQLLLEELKDYHKQISEQIEQTQLSERCPGLLRKNEIDRFRPNESLYPHIGQLKHRFDFLLFILSRTSAALGKEEATEVWQMYVINAHSKKSQDLVLAWFGKALYAGRAPIMNQTNQKNGPPGDIMGENVLDQLGESSLQSLEFLTRTALTEDATRTIFETLLPKLPCESVSIVGIRVYLSYFLTINTRMKSITLTTSEKHNKILFNSDIRGEAINNGHAFSLPESNLNFRRRRGWRNKQRAVAKIASKMFTSLSSPSSTDEELLLAQFERSTFRLLGDEFIWQLALSAYDSNVGLYAIETIVHFQLHLNYRMRSKSTKLHVEFIGECINRMKEACCCDNDTKGRLKLRRAAFILKDFLESFEAKDERSLELLVLPPAFDVPGSLVRRNAAPVAAKSPQILVVSEDITLQDLIILANKAVGYEEKAETKLRLVSSARSSLEQRKPTIGEAFGREFYSHLICSLGIKNYSMLKLVDLEKKQLSEVQKGKKCEESTDEISNESIFNTLNGNWSMELGYNTWSLCKSPLRLEDSQEKILDESFHTERKSALCADANMDSFHHDLLYLLDESPTTADDTVASKAIWECLEHLPMNLLIRKRVLEISDDVKVLFPENCIHALIINLEVVKTFMRGKFTDLTVSMNGSTDPNESFLKRKKDWSTRFVRSGGLNHLLDILHNHAKFKGERRAKCMFYLIDVISLLLEGDEEYYVHSQEEIIERETVVEGLEEGNERKLHTVLESNMNESSDPGNTNNLHNQRFRRFSNILGIGKAKAAAKNNTYISNIKVEASDTRISSEKLVRVLLDLILETANLWSGIGLVDVISSGMNLIETCVKAWDKEALRAIYSYEKLEIWIEKLLLFNTDFAAREIVSEKLFKLSRIEYGKSRTTRREQMSNPLPVFFCQKLLLLLDRAIKGRIHSRLFRSSCKEYFSLLANLIGIMQPQQLKTIPGTHVEDLFKKCVDLLDSHVSTEVYHSSDVDVFIVGIFELLAMIVEKDSDLINSNTAPKLCKMLVDDFLFPYPLQKNNWRSPKCKIPFSREFAFAVLMKFCCSRRNLEPVFGHLMNSSIQGQFNDETLARLGRSWDLDEDFVARRKPLYPGLTNKGATCYMNSFLQQLHKIPGFKASLLNISASRPSSLLQALQILFVSLSRSVKDEVDTQIVCEVLKEYDGRSLDVMEQKDVCEFVTQMFEQLEREEPQAKHCLRCFFGGSLVNQIVSKDEKHDYVSETKEPFYILPLDIKGKKNLSEALDAFVRGEIMTGDNKYQLPSGETVDAVKRSGIGTFPLHLIIGLKRFEFDHAYMKTKKLNDRFEFPYLINLGKYALRKLDKDNEQIEFQSDNEYELSGILAHSGTSNSGHYYSFIRERQASAPFCETHDLWFEYNDGLVWPYPPDRIPDDCFGGNVQFMGSGRSIQVKPQSAFMLFYDKRGDYEASRRRADSTDLNALRGDHELLVEQTVEYDNLVYVHDKYIFSQATAKFMWNLAFVYYENVGNNSKELVQTGCRILWKYFTNILIRGRITKETLNLWRRFFIIQITRSECCTIPILNAIDERSLFLAIVQCPHAYIRQVVAEVLAVASTRFFQQIEDQNKSFANSVGTTFNCPLLSFQNSIFGAVMCSLDTLHMCSEIFWLFNIILEKCETIRTRILRYPNLLECIVDALMATETNKAGLADEVPDLYSIYRTVSILVRAGFVKPSSPYALKPSYPIVSTAMHRILTCDRRWLQLLIETDVELSKQILGHLCWNSDLCSYNIKAITFCIESIKPSQMDSIYFLHYLRILQHLLSLSDGAERKRVSHFIPLVISHFHECLQTNENDDLLYYSSRMLLSLAATKSVYHFEISKHKEIWETWARPQRRIEPREYNDDTTRRLNLVHRDLEYLSSLTNLSTPFSLNKQVE